MRTSFLAAGLLLACAGATGASSQSVAPPASPVPSDSGGVATPTVPAPAPATPTAPAPGETPTPPASTTGQVTAFLNAQFPAADADGDGQLSRDEFIPWVTQLRQRQSARTGTSTDPAEAGTYANNAFARADVDRNNFVTRGELTTFLGG
jgi:hypothetical protein